VWSRLDGSRARGEGFEIAARSVDGKHMKDVWWWWWRRRRRRRRRRKL
jgi:hypothetical protein